MSMLDFITEGGHRARKLFLDPSNDHTNVGYLRKVMYIVEGNLHLKHSVLYYSA
jgi:hypothetical protein